MRDRVTTVAEIAGAASISYAGFTVSTGVGAAIVGVFLLIFARAASR